MYEAMKNEFADELCEQALALDSGDARSFYDSSEGMNDRDTPFAS